MPPAQDFSSFVNGTLTQSGQRVDLRRVIAQIGGGLGGSQFDTMQTDRWPLPGSPNLHPLDCVTIMGVTLPLAEMPEGADELDVSERKKPGQNHSSFVSHGKKHTHIKVHLLLFRDQTLGYENGQVRGKDWFREYAKLLNGRKRLIPKDLDPAGAVPVYYPTWAQRGLTHMLFIKQGDMMHRRGQFYTVELVGVDVRSLKKSGGSAPVKKHVEPITSTGQRVVVQSAAAIGGKVGGTGQSPATSAPSARKKGT